MEGGSRYTLELKYPASIWGAKWKDALPAGNGTIGAAVYGGVYEETVMLTHEELWWRSRTPEMPDVSDRLPEVRRLLSESKPVLADRILADALAERGYAPELGVPLPLGDLKIIMPGKQAFRKYRRRLDMSKGEIVVRWADGETEYERALFVSRTDPLVVAEIRKSGAEKIGAVITLDLHDRSDARMPDGNRSPLPKGLAVIAVADGFVCYAAANEDGTDFGAVARIIHEGGTMEAAGTDIRVAGAERIRILISTFVKAERHEAWSRLVQELQNRTEGYETLLQSHAEEHGALFGAMKFEIRSSERARSNEDLLLEAYQGSAPDELTEKMWAYGRYLLIASSRAGGLPCPLMGLWCGEYNGFWAFHMANENLQMIHWQALSGNMPELLLPLFDYVERQLEDYRTNARNLYGCRGIYIPGPTAPDSGLLKTLAPHIIHWTGAAGWIAQHYYDYFLHTGDLDFLEKRALPFMRETALFYRDFFTVGNDGCWISSPSNSPENTPGNYWKRLERGYEDSVMETTVNATMDFAIAKELLTHLLEGSYRVGFRSEETKDWEEMLRRIPPYQINEDGAIREWMHPHFEDNYHHRHQAHLYPVFPGTEVTRESHPEWFEAFRTAVRKRLVVGLKQQSGWSLAHMACTYARMGEGDLALECLDIISRSCLLNNFYTLHNDWRGMGIGVDLEWAPFQIDANMGWTAAIQEMLLFSRADSIAVFPALPARWRSGRAGPLLTRLGVELTLRWDLDAESAEITLRSPHEDKEVAVRLPEITEQGFTHQHPAANVKHVNLLRGEPLTFKLTRPI